MKIILMALALLCATPTMAADDLNSIYQGYAADTETSLDKPHRGITELGTWLSETAANALQYTPGNAAKKLGELRPQFTDAGFKTYTDFLTSMGFGDALQKQTLSLTSVVNSIPMLIGQGASAGRYAWAYEMQIVLSAAAVPGGPVVNKPVTLRVQVGRNAAAPGTMGVLIESWQAFVEPPANDSGQPKANP